MTTGAGKPLVFDETEQCAEPVDGAALLDALADVVRRYVVLDDTVRDAVALWILLTWLHAWIRVSPLLGITSPTKRCGKTTLLNVVGALAHRPLPASNITGAALFRVVEQCEPTLLVDEADSFLGTHEELRGILNSGHTRGAAFVIRTVGEDHEPRQFSTWAPKAVALIGKLPDTLHDRSIPVRLQRKTPKETAVRLRDLDGQELRHQCSRWTADHGETLRGADPEMPESLHDRAQDNWEPLLAIADLAGGEWPERARAAAVALTGVEGEPQRHDVMLLADCRVAFGRAERMHSSDLVAALNKMRERLSDFEIRPKDFKIPPDALSAKKGYSRASFKDAWSRYLDSSSQPRLRDEPEKTRLNGNLPSATMEPPVADEDARNTLQDKGPSRRRGLEGGGGGDGGSIRREVVL